MKRRLPLLLLLMVLCLTVTSVVADEEVSLFQVPTPAPTSTMPA